MIQDPILTLDPIPAPLSGAEGEADGALDPAPLSLSEEIARRAEEEGIKTLYPEFDPDEALAHPELGALLRGEKTPGLRLLYEAVHLESIVSRRVSAALDDAFVDSVTAAVESTVESAIASAVAAREEQLLENIRARGCRPAENGTAAASGIRMHPAAGRLTRRDRARLAERAERGETVRL